MLPCHFPRSPPVTPLLVEDRDTLVPTKMEAFRLQSCVYFDRQVCVLTTDWPCHRVVCFVNVEAALWDCPQDEEDMFVRDMRCAQEANMGAQDYLLQVSLVTLPQPRWQWL